MLLTRCRRDNTAAIVLLVLLVAATANRDARADEVRRWRDAEGRLHVEIVGDGKPADWDSGGHPIVSTSDPSPEDELSIRASSERRRIRRALEEAGGKLSEVRHELEKVRSQELLAWSPGLADGLKNPREVITAQQNAFLAVERFRHQKGERIADLRKAERKQLRTMRDLWEDFEIIRAEVESHFGTLPPWWRNEIDCGPCLSATAVERALAPPEEEEEESDEGSTRAPDGHGPSDPGEPASRR